MATSGANLYDGVMMIAKAIDAEHGSTAPAGIVKGLETVSYNGLCGTYRSDSQHNMAHTMDVVQYGATRGRTGAGRNGRRR